MLSALGDGAQASPAPDDRARLATATPVDVRSAALLISDQRGGDLPMAVGVAGTGVVVELDGRALLRALGLVRALGLESAGQSEPADRPPEPAESPAVVEIHAYALLANLEVAASSSLAVPLGPEDVGLLEASGLRTRLELGPLPAGLDGLGGARIRALARAGDSFALGGAETTIEGSDSSGPGSPSLPAARLAAPAGEAPWLEARAAGARESAAPLRARATAWAGETLEIEWASPGPPRAVPGLRAEIEPIAPARADAPGAGPLPLADPAQLAIPRELPSGLYRLRFAAEGRRASPPIEVVILGSDLGARRAELEALAWPALARLELRGAGSPSVTQIPAIELPEKNRRRARRLRARYLEVLRVIARGGLEAGSEALARFQTGAFRALGNEAPSALFLLETRITERLMRRSRNPQTLLPAVVVYSRLYARHRAAGRPRTAQHALDAGSAILQRYVQQENQNRQEAAACLAAFGVDRQLKGNLPRAQRLFEQALELDRDSSLAQLGLGLGAAWLGRFSKAEKSLGRYLKSFPDEEEIRLRQAVAEQRASPRGRRGSSVDRRLRALLDSETPWVACVAGQQWTRAAIDRGEFET
ncbi:MAG: tetratricopeptide repeat protein, partial [Acidobacteriota bacterium]